MDVVTRLRELEPPRPREALLRSVAAFVEREWLLVVLCSFIVLRDAYFGRTLLGSDSWFSFVYGRDILQHGLPHHDTLTVMGDGRPWIDQQWLGHIALYGLHALGGPSLAVNVAGVLFSLALVGPIVLARRRGGSTPVLVVMGGIAVLYATTVVQTEVFSRIFFVVLLAVLGAESRKRTRRVWLLLPLLALWANVHGAVVLGAALVALLGAVEVVHWRSGNPGKRALGRAVALLVLPWTCIFATPYGFAVAGYYRLTMFNSAFRQYIDPWKPPTPLTLWGGPFFILALIAFVLVVRHRKQLTLFEKAALALTLVAALDARRSIPWFDTAAILFVPVAVGRSRVARPHRSAFRLRFAAALFAVLFALLAVGQTWASPQRWYTGFWYDRDVVTVLGRYAAAHPDARFWAHDPYGDWVVFVEPSLWGKVAFDARWENLTRGQVATLSNFERRAGPGWETPIFRYDLIAISRHAGKRLSKTLARDPRLRLVFRDRDALIFAPRRRH